MVLFPDFFQLSWLKTLVLFNTFLLLPYSSSPNTDDSFLEIYVFFSSYVSHFIQAHLTSHAQWSPILINTDTIIMEKWNRNQET